LADYAFANPPYDVLPKLRQRPLLGGLAWRERHHGALLGWNAVGPKPGARGFQPV